jgi:hypothetical protein
MRHSTTHDGFCFFWFWFGCFVGVKSFLSGFIELERYSPQLAFGAGTGDE